MPKITLKRKAISPGGIWQIVKRSNNDDENEPKLNNDNEMENPIPLENRYSLLANRDEEINIQGNNIEETIKNKNKIPPIIYKNPINNYEAFITYLKEDCDSEVTTKCYNKQIKIQTSSTQDYEKLINNFKNDNINYHTYTMKETTEFKAVLKGLPASIKTDTICNDITKHKITTTKIVKMNTSSEHFPYYLVYFPPTTTLNEVRNIKYIFHTKIYWEPYRPRKRTTQCFRCQQYGHAARNCNGPEKCVKCGAGHDSRTCKGDIIIKCANCEEKHTANNPECAYYKAYVNKMIQQKQNSRQHTTLQNTRPAYHYEREDFPDLPKIISPPAWNRSTQPPPTTKPQNTEVDNDILDIIELNKEIRKLKSLCDIKKLIHDLKILNSKLEKTTNPLERLQIFSEYEENQK